MNIVFRTDASLQIGTGHVMRCLTLADALSAQGAECHFICREHPGHLAEFIRSKGYGASILPACAFEPEREPVSAEPLLAHADWLGVSWQQDADECAAILKQKQTDWMIVDHYALDSRWESALKPNYSKLMVIDDLADRSHVCHLLLDQTYSRAPAEYLPWVPEDCILLCGSRYALLRPEFAQIRSYSLQRRAKSHLRQLLITMGGVDRHNATGKVLENLKSCALPVDCRIVVVMGATAPWLSEVQRFAEQLPWTVEIKVNVRDMAQLMADSDFAIGAAGATSWERCCLGLPTIMLVLADNQRTIAQALDAVGAAFLCDLLTLDIHPLITMQQIEPATLSAMSVSAASITDGLGVSQVADILICKT
ncbi:UDP-2,4-diacetamido-2,4,6-trideoxy-beta-L-altropyranose hydrolase [Pseudomonas kilonensis]|uniref:UDP-2,4-diacetamido-2,4, 6-trideoxy-beta-L-altropyranose hydrolase n=1 Tax=Pseudomonas kilonensis TaxID=132476 RepID=UPI0004660B3A|nr:UDP-2,4-diacetamido-2,4,6-trideoxy-beta-L-altropyranose hydrolase [Pseudomonas kilonensis]